MAENFGPGILGGVVLVDPETGEPYKVTSGGGGGGAVDSVNGATGAVVLDATDVNARPDTWEPTVADISATGTADDTTYLRGDGAWAIPDSGAGMVDYADLPAGMTFTIRWNVDHWEDAVGTTITARPTGRTDLIMFCVTDSVTPPEFAVSGVDMLLRTGM